MARKRSGGERAGSRLRSGSGDASTPEASLDWNDLRYLLAIARKGSMTGAAKWLGVSQPTASRRLAALEEAAGLRLILRTPNGARLTEEGRRLSEVAELVAARLATMDRREGMGANGLVRLGITDAFARCLLEDGLPEIAERYPEIQVELVVGSGPADVARGEADLALRLVPPSGGHIVARKVGVQGYALFASQRYLARRGQVTDRNLARHTIIEPARELTAGPECAWLDSLQERPRSVLKVNSMAVALDAAERGLGLALLPEPLGRRASGVENVLGLPKTLTRTVYLVQHEDSRNVERIRLVAEALGLAVGRILKG
jgi:DNA-binding transcriptional LysR family regulator